MNLFNKTIEYISGENIHLALTECNKSIRVLLTLNHKISKRIQLILANNKFWEIRYNLYDNPNLCKEAKLILRGQYYILSLREY